eukprot:2096875-Pyramimonas_sp.AAC.1
MPTLPPELRVARSLPKLPLLSAGGVPWLGWGSLAASSAGAFGDPSASASPPARVSVSASACERTEEGPVSLGAHGTNRTREESI